MGVTVDFGVARSSQTTVAAFPPQVKFIDSPSIEQLRRQIVTVTEKIPMICEVGRSFDVDMEL